MPAQETSQPQTQQMELPTMNAGSAVTTEQPRVTEQMTAEPVSMRGGGALVLPASSASSAAVKRCTNHRSRAPKKEED
ncbi:hypothetical protein BP5796_10562 [Coleophoma crateriformis]|uniref:Uncharacterized protein n=1 Tax=Coleophoma crateriformis TaxID=565419 RepID=A0A3D8QQY9_9HELO|nr:hypothetical protein BP5796_10562 [Coleophoma crateriformis]